MTDLGITATSRSTFQRSALARRRPRAAPRPAIAGWSRTPDPRARGEYAVTAMFRLWQNATSSRWGKRGWSSIWFTAGAIVAVDNNAASSGSVKLDTPMARAFPSRTSPSIARQHSAMDARSSSCISVPRFQTTGQWIRYRSTYSSCRSSSVCAKPSRTSSGRRRSFHSLLVTNTPSLVAVPLANASRSAAPTSVSFAYAAAQSMCWYPRRSASATAAPTTPRGACHVPSPTNVVSTREPDRRRGGGRRGGGHGDALRGGATCASGEEHGGDSRDASAGDHHAARARG